MPIRNGDYVQRTDEEVFETLVTELLAENSEANPRAESTLTYAFLWALAQTIAQNQEDSLQEIYQAAYVVDATDEQLTKKARNLGIVRRDAQQATGVVDFTRSSPATQDYTIPSGTIVETLASDPIQFETTAPVTVDGPETVADGATYSEGSTTFTAKTSHTIQAGFRDSIDVRVDVKTSNASYSAKVRVVDATNNATIDTYSTTNTSYTTKGPTTYDVSNISEDVTIEYRVRITDTSATASIQNAAVEMSGQTGESATIEAVNGGSQGNVGPNAIQAMPSPPTGVEEVTNPLATGDPTLMDTTGDPLRVGRDRETDTELRNRVLDTDAVHEGPSADGVELALQETEGVISTHVNTNQTSGTVNGLDPYHSEVVVYGGDTYDVAQTLYETMSATTLLRLQGGVNGSQESTTVHSQLFDQDVSVPISRPTLLPFDATIDVVHENSYAGDVAVKDAVVEYVGGTYADDSTTTGIGIGENVLVNEIENRVEDVQGVDYANVTTLDTDGDGSDDTTTDSDGVPVLAVSNSEVSRVDADDVSLTLTAR